ncbi:MAG: hypothetical protein EA419_08935 [Wenzhouxiangella sp.]|nr:MAG: hypothetical protein EA419_08935 [Wenzhouxiangella sp.]
MPRIYHRESDETFFFSNDLYVFGNIRGTGAKSFIQPHREDSSSEIHYIAVEAGEAGVYWRGRC